MLVATHLVWVAIFLYWFMIYSTDGENFRYYFVAFA